MTNQMSQRISSYYYGRVPNPALDVPRTYSELNNGKIDEEELTHPAKRQKRQESVHSYGGGFDNSLLNMRVNSHLGRKRSLSSISTYSFKNGDEDPLIRPTKRQVLPPPSIIIEDGSFTEPNNTHFCLGCDMKLKFNDDGHNTITYGNKFFEPKTIIEQEIVERRKKLMSLFDGKLELRPVKWVSVKNTMPFNLGFNDPINHNITTSCYGFITSCIFCHNITGNENEYRVPVFSHADITLIGSNLHTNSTFAYPCGCLTKNPGQYEAIKHYGDCPLLPYNDK